MALTKCSIENRGSNGRLLHFQEEPPPIARALGHAIAAQITNRATKTIAKAKSQNRPKLFKYRHLENVNALKFMAFNSYP
jgi:hypothetical protein